MSEAPIQREHSVGFHKRETEGKASTVRGRRVHCPPSAMAGDAAGTEISKLAPTPNANIYIYCVIHENVYRLVGPAFERRGVKR